MVADAPAPVDATPLPTTTWKQGLKQHVTARFKPHAFPGASVRMAVTVWVPSAFMTTEMLNESRNVGPVGTQLSRLATGGLQVSRSLVMQCESEDPCDCQRDGV